MQLEAFGQDVFQRSAQNVQKLKAIQAAIVEEFQILHIRVRARPFWQFKLHGTAVTLTDSKVDRSECSEMFDTQPLADPLEPLLFKGFNRIYANLGKLLREQ